jgi:hypothetical protein
MSKQYSRVFNAKTVTGLRPGESDKEYVNTDIIPTDNNLYDIGTSILKWRTIYTNDLIASNNINVGEILSTKNAIISENMSVSGALSSGNNIPLTSNTYDLGTSTNRWRNIYTSNLDLSTVSTLQVGDINDTPIGDFDEPAVQLNRTFVTPRIHSTSYIASPFISTMGFAQVDKFYASRTTDTTSKIDSDAAVKIDGGVAIAKRAWADAFQADTEIVTPTIKPTATTVNLQGNLGVTGTVSTTGNVSVGGTLGVTGLHI